MLFAAGGTGGHLFPGVAVAEAARREVGAEILFVGTQQGMEKDMIPRLGSLYNLFRLSSCEGVIGGASSTHYGQPFVRSESLGE